MSRKVNIHLALPQETVRFCAELNKMIRDAARSQIVFDETSPMIPHITLLMGEIIQGSSLEDVSGAVSMIIDNGGPVHVRMLAPYLEDVRNHYVFSDVVVGDEFGHLQELLGRDLIDRHLAVQGDYSGTPHITLAYVNDDPTSIRQYLSEKQEYHHEFVCGAIEISDVGPKGTCVNTLYRFPLTR